jgi:hypothetical protein
MGRRKRHTLEQIVGKLREADALLNAGQSLGQVIQHLGVSEATYHLGGNAGWPSGRGSALPSGPASEGPWNPDSHSGWHIKWG